MYKLVAFAFVLYFHATTIHAFTESELDATDLFCLDHLKYDKKEILEFFDENDFIKEGHDKMNTFYACAWKKDHLQNEDGSLNIDDLQKMVAKKLERLFPHEHKYNSHVAKEAVAACKDVKGTNNGDSCVKIHNCLVKKIGEITKTVAPSDIH